MAGIEPLLRRLRINTVCYEDNGNYGYSTAPVSQSSGFEFWQA